MASKKTFEDLDLSTEEIKRIENALKDEKFRKMFVEYAEEISDPANRKLYEEEIAMMEQERGMDVQFVNPKPGHILKTVIDGKKAFVNICTSDKMGQPTSKKSVSETGVKGLMWQLPHSFSPPREDYDKAKKTCMVYDVVFHPDTYTMARNPKFLKLVEDTALEGIEKQFGVKVDKHNISRLKNLKYKGNPVATVIRTRKDEQKKDSKKDEKDILSNMPYPYGNETTAELTEKHEKEIQKKAKDEANKASKTKTTVEKKAEEGFTTPKFSIIHRSNMDIQEFRNAPDARPSTRPKELVVSIELPLCKSASGVDLDIFEDKLSLKSEKPAYKLDLKLPYAVDDENGSAKFDKSKNCLVVTLPVVPGVTPDLPKYGEEGTETQQNVPPLIEELPPLEDVTELPPLEDVDDPLADEKSEKNDHPECTEKKVKPQISYALPEYDFNQDSETVTFICHVRNVKDDTVSRSFPSPSSAEVKFISIGSGGFPMHYCLSVAFDADCRIVPEHTTIDASEKNLTVTFLKEKDCRIQWNKIYVGADNKATEEKLFLTTENLQEELDQLQTEGEAMGRTEEHPPETAESEVKVAEVKVTEMNPKKLRLKITNPKATFTTLEDGLPEGEDDDLPLSANIEVVHTSEVPNLHGILKSRSSSESSTEDQSSSGDSPTSSSPRDSDGNRRSVTFSNHVDKATFKTTATVSSLTKALKAKRRNQRRREGRKGGRQRHNSNGSEGSSCDDTETRRSSESYSEEDVECEPEADQEQQAGPEVEDCGNKTEEVPENITKAHAKQNGKTPGYQIHSKKGKSKKKGKKIADEVKSKMAGVRANSSSGNDSDDDEEEIIALKRTNSVESEAFVTRDENQQKLVEVTRESAAVEKVEKVEMAAGQSDLKDTSARINDSGGTMSDTSGAINDDNKGSCKKGVRFSENVDCEKGDSGNGESGTKGGNGSKSGKKENQGERKVEQSGKGDNDNVRKGEVETELSWKEVDRESPFNAHKTQCAFSFSNDVMFDLDID